MKGRRRRSSLLPRPDWRLRHGQRPTLLGQTWFRRGERRVRRDVDPGDRRRRALAIGLAVLEMALAGVLIFSPLFTVHDIEVTGAHRLSPDQVVAITGMRSGGSLFTVDSGAIERRLGGSPWVRTASVSTGLPDHVLIQVDEWQPVATYRAGSSRPWYLSDQAVALGPVPDQTDRQGLVDIQGPGGTEPGEGQRLLDVRLLLALVNMQRQLPGLLGQQVGSFQLDSCGNLTMVAAKGWKAQFGRVLTPEEFTSLEPKLAALKSASAQVNYDDPNLGYVNVMNPTSVAVGAKPTATPPPRAGAKPSPSLTPAPTPTPSGVTGPVVIGSSPGPQASTVSGCR